MTARTLQIWQQQQRVFAKNISAASGQGVALVPSDRGLPPHNTWQIDDTSHTYVYSGISIAVLFDHHAEVGRGGRPTKGTPRQAVIVIAWTASDCLPPNESWSKAKRDARSKR